MRGRLILMGSGEIAPSMVATHRAGLAAADTREVVILDTPFGFQENVEQLAARIVDYFRTSLVAKTVVASLRAPDAPAVVRERMQAAVRSGRYVFAGPGSPSYALRIWNQIGLADTLVEVIERGGTVTLASAAALTAGEKTIPVYEIYKVGVDPFWLDGLDLSGRLGLAATVIPHWNNAEGGNHDTSRCYIGRRRLSAIEGELTAGIIGVDEHTAATLDFAAETITVSGNGAVTFRGALEEVVPSGSTVTFDDARRVLGTRPPSPERVESLSDVDFARAMQQGDADGLLAALLEGEESIVEHPAGRSAFRAMLVQVIEAARAGLADPREAVAGFVELLLDLRAEARASSRFEESDRIRDRLSALGVEVRDTRDGVEWEMKHRG